MPEGYRYDEFNVTQEKFLLKVGSEVSETVSQPCHRKKGQNKAEKFTTLIILLQLEIRGKSNLFSDNHV